MPAFLTESALLAHGLVSIGEDALLESWPSGLENIAWVDGGEICIGGMERFLPFRRRAEGLLRIDWESLAAALAEGASGALTASGTMAVCQSLAWMISGLNPVNSMDSSTAREKKANRSQSS